MPRAAATQTAIATGLWLKPQGREAHLGGGRHSSEATEPPPYVVPWCSGSHLERTKGPTPRTVLDLYLAGIKPKRGVARISGDTASLDVTGSGSSLLF